MSVALHSAPMGGSITERCVCGNVLATRPGQGTFTVTSRPCRCEDPGPGSRQGHYEPALPGWVSRRQYEERTRLGLPVVANIERKARVV